MRNESLLVTTTAILSIAGCHGGGDDPTDRGPTVSAGADQIVDETSTVQLAGASSGGSLALAWSQISGPTVTLSSTTSANPTFTAPVVAVGTTAVIELRLEVTNSAGTTASDTVRITAKSSDSVIYTDIRSGFAGIYSFDAETNTRTALAELTGLFDSPPRIAPDGSRVVYMDDAFDVWSVRLDGTGRANLGSSRIRGYFTTDGQIHAWSSNDVVWSPDSAHVVYSADRDSNDVREVYVVRADGSRETQLLDAVTLRLQWSPDGSRIGFLRSGGYELYNARPDGTDMVKLSDAALNISGSDWSWSPDGARIAYKVKSSLSQPPGVHFELSTVRPDGTERARVFEPDFVVYDWLSTGSLVVNGDPGGTNDDGLFTVRPDGSALTKLNGAVPPAHYVGLPTWSRNASRIGFGVFESGSGTPWPPGDLFTVRPDGTGRVQLNDARLVGMGVGGYRWAPDGSRIAYHGPQTAGGVVELFSVRSDGTGRVRLNADPPPGVTLLAPPIWSPDSSRLAFFTEQQATDGNYGYTARDVLTVRADGADRVKLNAPLAVRRTVVRELTDWAPDGSRLLYFESESTPEVTDTIRIITTIDGFSVLPDGTGRVKLSPGARTYSASWSPDGSRLLFKVIDQATGRTTLGVSRPDGTGAVPIQEWNNGEGEPRFFRWAP